MYIKNSLLVCIQGLTLSALEVNRLMHPLVGGVILFSRNFANSKQLRELISQIKNIRGGELVVSVDQEGGRVQRFRTDEFTKIPAMGCFYDYFVKHDKLNDDSFIRTTLNSAGFLMAMDCKAHHIDFSFAPVLDLERGSDVIGDRAFHSDAAVTLKYASYFIEGLKQANFPSIGKHFPGHGSTKEDSHFHSPIDKRNLADVIENDGSVFKKLIEQNMLDAIMPAHIIFELIDSRPVGYSAMWLSEILKKRLGFEGCIFSDDLSMVGAGQSEKGELSYKSRYLRAIEAGCDVTLICNQPEEVDQFLKSVDPKEVEVSKSALSLLLSRYRGSSPVKPNKSELLVNSQQHLCSARELMADILS